MLSCSESVFDPAKERLVWVQILWKWQSRHILRLFIGAAHPYINIYIYIVRSAQPIDKHFADVWAKNRSKRATRDGGEGGVLREESAASPPNITPAGGGPAGGAKN